MSSAEGEDRSSFQPVEGWAGLSFGFAKATEATNWLDPTFADNWANMRAEGIHRGAYHFFHPADSPAGQASFFMDTVLAQGLEDGDMLAVDVEILSGVSETPARAALEVTAGDLAASASLDALVQQFCQACAARAPHSPIVTYTNHDVGQYLPGTAARFPALWFAWPSDTAPDSALIAPWTGWRFWQWGTTSGVDADGYNGTEADLQAWLDTYVTPPAPAGIEVVTVTSTGTKSLIELGAGTPSSPAVIIYLTFRQFGYQDAFALYVERADWSAPVPRGVQLAIKENA